MDQISDVDSHVLNQAVLSDDQVSASLRFDDLFLYVPAKVALQAFQTKDTEDSLHDLIVVGCTDGFDPINAAIDNTALTIRLGEILNEVACAHHADVVGGDTLFF